MLAPIQALIRKAAGAIAPRTRRGTVLLLVLGSLTLVLILAVVYAAVGRGDRRTAQETQVRKEAVANIDAIADHFMDVIARDVFNLVPEVTDSVALEELFGTQTPIMRREAVDLPVTDYYFTSVPPLEDGVGNNQNAITAMRFHPDGGHYADLLWNEPPSPGQPFDLFDVDPRSASDPFLAATRPVDLGASSNLGIDDLPPYLRARDWAQISNFAPDGRFVNLFYLRPSVTEGTGFGASSLDLTVAPNSNTSRLSLFDGDGNPTTRLPYQKMADPSDTDSEDADWNKPMHWTMNQRWLFRPINDPALTDPSSSMSQPDSPDYWAYQYADADGDGFLDSRWIELVDYTNPVRPVSVLGENEMRIFVAARAIDLSSLVNVATATDSLTPSTLGHRIGAGPQDISLFKLLNMAEHGLSISGDESDPNTGGLGYDTAFETGTGMTGDYGEFDNDVAKKLGRKSYLRLTQGAEQGSVAPYNTVPGEQNARTDLSNDLRDYTLSLDASERLDYAASVGSVYPGVTAGGNSRTAPYSIDDLVELLTFHGINDDRNFSTLERALSAVNDGSDIPISSFSLARSDNPTTSDAWPPTGRADALDLKYLRSAVDIRRMLTTVSGSRPLRSSILEQADFAALSENADRKILLDNVVLSDGTYPTVAINPLDTVVDINDQQSELLANTFKVYLDLLAPDLRQEDWDQNPTTNPNYEQTKTQYYGYMGPELAVRIAGHMALNFRDMADAPYVINPLTGLPDVSLMPPGSDRFNILNLNLSDPTDLAAYNRRVDEPSVAAMRLARDWEPDIATGLLKQLWDAGLKLDIDEIRGVDPGELVADDGVNTSHHAMILYGVEPQPFLSQVSSMVMYSDTNRGNADRYGNDDVVGEWEVSAINGSAGPNNVAGDIDDFDGLPNIDGDVTASNPDFLFQALFFQLFNPFDVPIVLDRYYIEFGDSFYSFTTGTGTAPVIIEPHSTVVVWTSNPGDPAAIDARLSNAGIRFPPFGSGTSSAFEQMIETQIGTDVTLVQLGKRYSFIAPGSPYELVLPADVRDLFHLPTAARSDANRVAMLWRDAASYDTTAGTGFIDWTQDTLPFANRATDQLVDRLRDTSSIDVVTRSLVGGPARGALDRRLDLPTLFGPNREIQVNDAIRGDEANRGGPGFTVGIGGTDYNFDMQLAVALWGNISRKEDSSFNSGTAAVDYYTGNAGAGTALQGDLPVDGTPIGALPAKVFEANAHTPGSVYDPFLPSAYLANEVHVAGDEDPSFVNGIMPEELSLLTHFSPLGDTPFPDATSTDLTDFWPKLQNGLVSPLIFEGLGTPVFARGAAVALSLPMPPKAITNESYDGSRYIKVTVNQTEFRDLVSGRRTLRVGDMLLPLAVGAYRTPLAAGVDPLVVATPTGVYSDDVNIRLQQYEYQWTTLGESLAAAAGYSDSVGPGPSDPNLAVYDPFRSLSFDFPTPTTPIGTPKQEKYVLDRGQLRLDAFVPFINIDVSTGSAGPLTEGSGDFDPEVNIRRGLGIPMALNIFELAQAGTDMGLLAMGGLDRPVMGTINTNTAEPEVLRLHPALAMDMFAAAGAAIPDRLWWPRTLMQLPLNPTPYRLNVFEDKTLSGTPASFADVGSFIAAYRDPARYALLNLGNPLGGGGTSVEVDVFERTLVDDANPALGVRLERRPLDPSDPAEPLRSGIQGLRTGQGILSIGELFAARDMDDNKTQHHMGGFARDDRTIGLGFVDQRDPDNANYLRGLDFYTTIDAAKINELRAGQIQIATFGNHPTGDLIGLGLNYGGGTLTVPGNGDAYPGAGGAALPIMPDQIPDSYDEQLVQLNAVLNSMTVRSDYYAVWFVVHGYKESDTVGLTDTDPLTPSFAARYLMILDRSNVTQKGDRPRVLARVQLPMLPAPPAGVN